MRAKVEESRPEKDLQRVTSLLNMQEISSKEQLQQNCEKGDMTRTRRKDATCTISNMAKKITGKAIIKNVK